MPGETSDLLGRVLALFEAARQAKGAGYDPARFMAFLTEPPARAGRLVADTFRGRRCFVRFMESAQLEFGICFTNEEWERGFSLDEFVERIESKLSKPEQAHRLACTRLEEARRPTETIKVGLVATLLLVVPVIAFGHPIVRVVIALVWTGIMGTLARLSVVHRAYYKKLVERTAEKTS